MFKSDRHQQGEKNVKLEGWASAGKESGFVCELPRTETRLGEGLAA